MDIELDEATQADLNAHVRQGLRIEAEMNKKKESLNEVKEQISAIATRVIPEGQKTITLSGTNGSATVSFKTTVAVNHKNEKAESLGKIGVILGKKFAIFFKTETTYSATKELKDLVLEGKRPEELARQKGLFDTVVSIKEAPPSVALKAPKPKASWMR